MKTQLDIQKIIQITKKGYKKTNQSFDQGLMGLGIKISVNEKSK